MLKSSEEWYESIFRRVWIMEQFSLSLYYLIFFFLQNMMHFQKHFKLVEFLIKEQNEEEFFTCCLPLIPSTSSWGLMKTKKKKKQDISDQGPFCFSLGSHFPSNVTLCNIKLWSIPWIYMRNSDSKHFLICGHHGW